MIERNSIIRELELLECDLSKPQIETLFNSLKKNTSLENLRFQLSELLNMLDDKEQNPFASFIDSNSRLKRLHISGSKYLNKCVVQLFKAKCKSLQFLTLNQHFAVVDVLVNHFPKFNSLQEIRLPLLPLGSAFQMVVESIGKSPSLDRISFAPAQAFSNSDVISLASFLASSHRISSISLQSGVFQDESSLSELSQSHQIPSGKLTSPVVTLAIQGWGGNQVELYSSKAFVV
jgi:hypothetical protein